MDFFNFYTNCKCNLFDNWTTQVFSIFFRAVFSFWYLLYITSIFITNNGRKVTVINLFEKKANLRWQHLGCCPMFSEAFHYKLYNNMTTNNKQQILHQEDVNKYRNNACSEMILIQQIIWCCILTCLAFHQFFSHKNIYNQYLFLISIFSSQYCYSPPRFDNSYWKAKYLPFFLELWLGLLEPLFFVNNYVEWFFYSRNYMWDDKIKKVD